KVPRTSGTEDCSPIAPSAGVPTGCRRTLAAARRAAIAPAGSKDGLRSRKAAKGYSSARPTHRAQASGSFSADGSSAPAPQAKCTKRADPDRKILPACKPPPIRDRKTESANPRYGEGVFSKLLVHIPLVLPRVVTGYLLLISFGRRGPIGAFLADHFGIVFSFRWTGAALSCGVMGFPLLVRPIRLAIEAIDRKLEDAAATLGA